MEIIGLDETDNNFFNVGSASSKEPAETECGRG